MEPDSVQILLGIIRRWRYNRILQLGILAAGNFYAARTYRPFGHPDRRPVPDRRNPVSRNPPYDSPLNGYENLIILQQFDLTNVSVQCQNDKAGPFAGPPKFPVV